ncbi:MAG: DNA polymerase III subunit beta [Anaeromicrobium sp.]|jgi:DNA polymerase-3 subunit beta|uniref:DNA polymerase III subunit beta n=1 Tax=Anaeromicrobium sp. TaxID=1929132 RepID=UPI0025E2F6C0|nr:DNA polymerase III subunit beta [Anaeromicrobium sp.]MCT4594655.1 DNA polymerase III subunit beta [Anaeromicrobium sp.]
MKFICSQKVLASGIGTVQKAISSKSNLPILKGILLEAYDDKLKLVGTDLEIGIENYIDAEIIKEGSLVLSARILGDIVRKLPDDNIEIEVHDNNKTIIRCRNSEFTLLAQNSEDFPDLPEVEEDYGYTISQDLLKNMIRQTVFATAIDETRPILMGVLMKLEPETINMVALDGYRLALREATIKSEFEGKAVIPAKTLNEINRLLSEEDGQEVRIYITDKHILFNMNNTKVVSRLLEGEFINYKQIIPTDYKSRLTVNTKDLLNSIERASLLAKEGKNNLVKLSIRDEELTITSNAEIGNVLENVSIDLEGKDLDIGFNSKYFIDALKIIDSEQIQLEFTTNVSPCIIKPTDNENYTYLILPVRIVE